MNAAKVFILNWGYQVIGLPQQTIGLTCADLGLQNFRSKEPYSRFC